MTSMPKPSDLGNAITATYDAWNRLVEVEDDGTLVARFRYDGEGRRILKMLDSDSPGSPDGLDTYEHIFLSGQQVIETREGSGAAPAQAETLQPKYQNVWSPRYIDALILRDENTDSDGACDDGRVYALADANFNVTALVAESASGQNDWSVRERYLYSPYGAVTVLDNDFSADADGVSDYNNTTLYTGREYDPQTGLMYYRARYYHAHLGKVRQPRSDWVR
jgi:RHS repeat-associated protein